MDRYEYKVRVAQIKSLIENGEFYEAMTIADTIDWRRVRSVQTLGMVSEVYKINRKYDEAREILLMAYRRHPGSRSVVYALCELSIRQNSLTDAVSYLKEYMKLAGEDPGVYILQYKLYQSQGVGVGERIELLKKLKALDYQERWAYELAYLYHQDGQIAQCISECDEMIVWFGRGTYVTKAMELKMLHAPLTPDQQNRYDHRNDPVRLDPGSLAEADVKEAVPEPEPEPEPEPVQPKEQIPISIKKIEPSSQQTREFPRKKIRQEIVEDEISVRPYNMDAYSTINLQAEIRKNLAEYTARTGETLREPEQPIVPRTELPMASEILGRNDSGRTEAVSSEPEEENREELKEENREELTESEAAEELYGAEAEPEEDSYEAESEPEEGSFEAESEPEEGSYEEEAEPEEDSYEAESDSEEVWPEEESYEEEAEPEEDYYGEESEPEEDSYEAESEPEEDYYEAESEPEEDYYGTEAEPEEESYEAETEPEEDYYGTEAEPEEESYEAESEPEEESYEAESEPEEESYETEAEPEEESYEAEAEPEKASYEDRIARPKEGGSPERVRRVPARPVSVKVPQPVPLSNIKQRRRSRREEQEAAAPVEKIQEKTVSAAEERRGYESMRRRFPNTGKPVDRKYSRMLAEEYDGQISLNVPAGPEELERQITGQLNLEDILNGWNRQKEEHDRRRIEDAKRKSLQQTNDIVNELVKAVPGFDTGKILGADPMNAAGPADMNQTQGPEIPSGMFGPAQTMTKQERIREAVPETSPEAVLPVSEGEREQFPGEVRPSTGKLPTFRTEPVGMKKETLEVTSDLNYLLEKKKLPAGSTYSDEESEGWQEEEYPSGQESYPEEELYSGEEDAASEEAPERESLSDTGRITDGESDSRSGPEEEETEDNKKGGRKNGYSGRGIGAGKHVIPEEREVEGFSEEEKEIFSDFLKMADMPDRIRAALSGMEMRGDTGNVIITGNEKNARVRLAGALAHDMKEIHPEFLGKIAKIPADMFNSKNVSHAMAALDGGALVIEQAADLSDSTLADLREVLRKQDTSILVILEESRAALRTLEKKCGWLEDAFNVRIEIPTFSNDDLVVHAREYAKEREYRIDDLGILALYTRIDEISTPGHFVTITEVEEIVDKAIKKANKHSLQHLIELATGKRYDENDLIILRERDFE